MGKANSQFAAIPAPALPGPQRVTIVSWLAALAMLLAALVAPAASAQTIIYVNDDAPPGGNGVSWATAFRDLQSALEVAEALPGAQRNVEIWIGAGTYVPTRQRELGVGRSVSFIIPRGVALLGGFVGNETSRFPRQPRVNQTILSGDIASDDSPNIVNRNDNAFSVVLVDADQGTATLDGVTVRGGHADGPQATADTNFWYLNRADGAGIAIRAGNVTIVNCEIVDNFARLNGGGINAFSLSFNVIVNIHSSVISNNTSVYAAAVFGGEGNVITNITNCTIVDNFGNSPITHGGSIIYAQESSMQIRNTIFARNHHNNNQNITREQFFSGTFHSCTFRLSHCMLQMNVPVSPLIPENVNPVYDVPVFATSGVTPYALAPSSPGIDAGSVAFVQHARDFLYNRRVRNVPDIGATEVDSLAFTPRIYVNERLTTGGNDGSSWSNAFRDTTSLRDALAYAAIPTNGVEEIWIAAGTYTPSPPLSQGGSRSQSFNLRNNLALYGGFQGNETLLSQRNPAANASILSGDLNADDTGDLNREDNSFHVLRSVTSGFPVVDGLTITAGNANGSTLLDQSGGGCLITDALGGAHFMNCRFVGNRALNAGGAVAIYRGFARATGTTFDTNIAGPTMPEPGIGNGGAIFVTNEGASMTLDRCTLMNNRASWYGGAVANFNWSSITVKASTFLRNRAGSAPGGAGGAVFTGLGATATTRATANLIACKFFGNAAPDGSALGTFQGGSISAANALLAGNVASASCVIYIAPSDPGQLPSQGIFENCTVTYNQTTAVGPNAVFSGIIVEGISRNNTLAIRNSIVWQNGPRTAVEFTQQNQVAAVVGVEPLSVAYSQVQGWTGSLGGTANNGLDPLFLRAPSPGPDQSWGTPDDDYGDLRLSSNSPAIDSGDSLAVPQDTYDIDQDGNTTEALPLDLAGQPRFYDDPTRANTGNGNPPVDRGAYENNLATTTWADPFGGRFDDATNWAGGVPTSTVRAVFDSSIGLNRAYTVTIPTNQSAYSLSVLANELNINLRGLTTSGNLTLAGPGTDQNAPTLLVSGPAGVPTGLAVTNTGNSPRTLFAGNGVVAAAAGTAANLRIDGSRASLQFANTLDLGLAGSAQVSVVNRGWLGATSLRAGLNPGSVAGITVAGTPGVGDSLLSLAGPGADEVILASRGTATLTATNQALIAGIDALDRVVLAEHPGSVATLSLSGLGTLWDTSQNDLIFAKAGTANISITDGAQLTTATANSLILAEQPGSVANITIGPGSNWTELVQSVVLAGEGEATITMLPGSSLNFQSNLVVNPAGTIQGSGTITGGVFNVGTVRVGNSPGTLTINGSFRQLAGQSDPDPARRNRAGQLEMEVQGLAPNQYDRLIINPGVGGTAELGGGLIVRLGQGIDIADNTQLPIITGPRGATRFDAALLPSLPNNRFARVIYGSGLNSPVNLGVQPLQPPYSPDEPEGAAVAGIPSAVIAADFDNDGDPDLAVTVPDEVANQPGAVFVMRNAGVQAGNWQGFPSVDILQLNTGIDPQDIDAADMDGDGLPEFIVANKGSDNVVIYKNTAGTGFTPLAPIATGNAPVSVSAAVFFDSGTATQLPDLLVANELDETVQFYRNSDAPGPPVLLVRPAVTVPGRPVRTRPSDLDNDKRRKREAVALVAASGTAGSQDAVVPLVPSGPDGPNANFLRLPSVPVPSAPKDLISHNLNSVPTDDVIVISQSGTLSVLRNRTPVEGAIGTEPLAPAVNLPIAGVGIDLAAIDIDGDNDLDVAIVTSQTLSPSSPRDVLTLRNLSDESTMIALAEPESLSATGADPLLVVGADVDTSGIDDVIYLGVPPECATCLTTPQNVFTRPAPVTTPSQCDTIDFNNDGLFPDDADLIEFLSVLSGVDCTTGTCNDIDFNNDGLFPDDADLSAFLRVLSGADCQ